MEQKNKKYGSFNDLDADVETLIKKHFEILDFKGILYVAYYGYPIIDVHNIKTVVKCLIISKSGIYVLFSDSKELNTYISKIYEMLAADSLLFGDLRKSNFIIEVDIHQDDISSLFIKEEIFSDEMFLMINRAIQQSYSISKEDDREVSNLKTLGYKLKNRNTYIGQFDVKQFNTIHSINIGENTRIRGLAGSGKTVLMVKRLAYLHFRYPDLDLAYIFYTISLKQYIEELFRNYFRDYTRNYEPNMSKIHIFHCWGSTSRSGYYYKLCQDFNLNYMNLSDALQQKSSTESAFDYVCRKTIQNIDEKNIEPKCYDYVFIDEAQDFGLPFFKLIKKSIKNNGAFSYAYDELQSLSSENIVPSKSDIFQNGENCIDVNLDISYRVPVEILVTAHAIGTGVYRVTDTSDELKIVNMIEDLSIWSDIGYIVKDGKLENGQHVILARKERLTNDQIINVISFKTRREQYENLSKKIIDIIKNEDVFPEDIIIIDQDSYYIKNNFAMFRLILMEKIENEIKVNKDKFENISINLVDKDNPARMKIKSSISYTTIYRAKGNEANLVFVINVDALESVITIARNKLFTAMTRARYAVWLMGIEIEAYEKEVEKVKTENYCLDFVYPSKEEMQTIKNYGRKESAVENQIRDAMKSIKEIEKVDVNLAKRLLNELLRNIEGEK